MTGEQKDKNFEKGYEFDEISRQKFELEPRFPKWVYFTLGIIGIVPRGVPSRGWMISLIPNLAPPTGRTLADSILGHCSATWLDQTAISWIISRRVWERGKGRWNTARWRTWGASPSRVGSKWILSVTSGTTSRVHISSHNLTHSMLNLKTKFISIFVQNLLLYWKTVRKYLPAA